VRVDRITVKGITTYREEQTLDLAGIGPGIVAVAGPNGSGKTSILEAVPGCIYRTTPSRGGIASLATARDARIEVEMSNGTGYRAVVDVDNHTGKSEACLFDSAGGALAGPKVRDFDREIGARFPPLDVFLAAAFASQTGAGSIMRMSRADRKTLFLRLLGLERLETMAAEARKRAAAAEIDLVASRAAIEAGRAHAGDVDALRLSLADARAAAQACIDATKASAADVERTAAEVTRLHDLLAEAQRAERAAQAAERKAEAAREDRDRWARELRTLGPILADADAIRARAADAREAATAVRRLEAEAGRAKAAFNTAVDRDRAATLAAEKAAERVDSLADRLAQLRAVTADADGIREAAARIATLSADMETTREQGEAERASVDTLRDVVAQADKALDKALRCSEVAREGLASLDRWIPEWKAALDAAKKAVQGVPCSGRLDDDERAGCPALRAHFEEIARRERQLADVPADRKRHEAEIAALSGAEEQAREVLAAQRAELAEAEAQLRKTRDHYVELKAEHDRLRNADRSAELSRAEAEAAGVATALEAAEQAAAAARDISEEARKSTSSAGDALSAAQGAFAEAAIRNGALRDAGVRLAALEEAERQAATIRGRLDGAGPAAEAAEVEAASLRASVPAVDMAVLRAAETADLDARQAWECAAAASTEAGLQVARVGSQLAAAEEAHAKVAELVAVVAPRERDVADWRFLARGLGKDGVQALEIDAAGPRVSDLCNELLQECYGSRFVVRLDTQAAKADGRSVKETFDVVVVDTERGRETTGDDLSGGERVIVGEALGLAVGLFHGQSSGTRFETVFRDETVGALDPENAERYLAMLRAAMRIGGIHQLLFVAHSPALVDLADAVVRVQDGRIEVET
jgi:exonuclease SbcC